MPAVYLLIACFSPLNRFAFESELVKLINFFSEHKQAWRRAAVTTSQRAGKLGATGGVRYCVTARPSVALRLRLGLDLGRGAPAGTHR